MVVLLKMVKTMVQFNAMMYNFPLRTCNLGKSTIIIIFEHWSGFHIG